MRKDRNIKHGGVTRRIMKAAGILAVSCIYVPVVVAGDNAPAEGIAPDVIPLEQGYDFSRWDARAMSPSDAATTASFGALKLPQPSSPLQSFSYALRDLIIPPGSQSHLGPRASMVQDTGYDLSGGAGFLSGGDVTTALFYTAGAAIGVIGTNLKVDEDSTGTGGTGNTSFIHDPASFQTPEFNSQYGLGKVGAHYAYARGHDGDGVLVSVMDTPFNTSHANLAGAFIDGYNPADGSTNVALDCTSPSNPCRHGTHVAGIIAARKTDIDSSMHGVAYKAKVKPVAFLNDDITTGQQQVDAFTHASGKDNSTDLQIVAMNNSWGPIAGFHSQTYNGMYFKVPNQTSISSSNAVYLGSSAAADADTIMVFASGNDGWNSATGEIDLYTSTSDSVPSSTATAADIVASAGVTLDNANRVDSVTAMPINAPDTSHYIIDADENEHMWLVVVATDQSNTITDFSNGCGVTKSFCLAAPGQMIKSTDGGAGSAYVDLPGTSMAAPHVTGAIAILADMYPNLLDKPENISQILLETATDLGAEGVDDVYGHGLLNLQDATGPLGNINIADEHFGSSGTPYNGGAVIETPVAFGDALATQNVQIGGVDKFDRVFMLHLPIQSKDMAGDTLSHYAHKSLPAATSSVNRAGLSLIGDKDSDNNIINSGLSYSANNGAGQIHAQLQMNMDVQRPTTGASAPLGYDKYFNAMAFAGKTRERMALNMSSARDEKGQTVSSDIQMDRDDQNRLTMISSSTSTHRLGKALASFTLGGMSEEGRVMGGELSGPLSVSSSHTIFAKSKLTLPLGKLGHLVGFYEIGSTDIKFKHDNLVDADRMTTDSYGLTWNMDAGAHQHVFITLHRPVAVTSGQLRFNTLNGYTDDGDYRQSVLSYNMAPHAREAALLAEYRRQFFPGGQVILGLSHQQNAHNIAGVENSGGFMRAEMDF